MPEILDPSKPPNHIAQIPAGYKRKEENARRTDALAEEAAAGLGPDGAAEPIDKSKLNHIDNEIAQPMENFNEFTEFEARGSVTVTHPQPGYRYLWSIKQGSDKIAAHIQMTHNTLLQIGYELVQGDPDKGGMQECRELCGSAAAGGSTQRGWGDCVLYRITVEQHDKLGRYRLHLLRQQNNVEEAFEAYGERYAAATGGNHAHGRRNDPMLMRTVYAGGAGQAVGFEREIKAGTIPGFAPGSEMGGRR